VPPGERRLPCAHLLVDVIGRSPSSVGRRGRALV